MGEIEPASDDASLSTVLVHRADGLAHRPLERNQPTAGINPAIAGVLINRSKEPDAGPHVRFCEKHGGVILRAYSTRQRRGPERPGFTGVTLSEILTNEMQPKIFNQTRSLANLMTKGVSKSLTRSGRGHPVRLPPQRHVR